eukprot:272928_1
MPALYRIDQLILWDHPNSYLVIEQSKRLLSQYNIFFEGGFQEFRLLDAHYDVKKIDGRRKSSCTLQMPGTDVKFIGTGGITIEKHTSMRLATFRVIKKILTYLYDFDWSNIQFELTTTREGGFRCRSNKIKLPQRARGRNKKKHRKDFFYAERLTRPYGPKKNYPAYCRIGAGIEFIDKLCNNLEYIGPLSSLKRRKYGWENGYDTPAPLTKIKMKKRSHRSISHTNILARKKRKICEKHNGYIFKYDVVSKNMSVGKNLVSLGKNLNYFPVGVSMRKGVNEWNYYGVIYWFNRVNNCIFSGVKYANFRKHIYIGKIRGNELCKINDLIFKMAGLIDINDHKCILKAISNLLINDKYYNYVSNALLTDDIPYKYFDPITYEIMQDPVILNMSGNTHDRKTLEQYIKMYNKDPITQKPANINDCVLTPNIKLKREIDVWISANFNLNIV